MNKKKGNHKINNQITNPTVRLVGENTENRVYNLTEAMEMANNLEVDLIMINESANPPVCKLIEYSKFLYDQNKKMVVQKQKPMKEIKISLNIGENDLGYKTKHIIEFLQKGHQVKITLVYRGREMAFINKGRELLINLINVIAEYGTPDSIPTLEGKQMFVLLRPKK